jgi:spore germination cell wall hydrolase CwlJ-like protein
MAENIYYEAGNQSYAGKIAVGHVVLNRVNAPGFPRTICGVIYDGAKSQTTTVCQFSWLCAPRAPINKSSTNWTQSVKAAKELLSTKESAIDITDGALNYHADYVKPPWAKQLRLVATIDNHLFYARK